MKRMQWLWIVVGLAATAWAVGCGDDAPGPPPVRTTIDVRNGTWSIHEISSYSGADSCLARGEKTVDTIQVVCARDLLFAKPGSSFPVTCEVDTVGDDVQWQCRIQLADLGICYLYLHTTGTGTITDTTFDLISDYVQEIKAKKPEDAEASERLYGRFADDCTLHVSTVAFWVDSLGSFLCPDDALSAKVLPFSPFLPSVVKAALTGR
jgi:hypothetical protein